jgi:hypothetical protein
MIEVKYILLHCRIIMEELWKKEEP